MEKKCIELGADPERGSDCPGGQEHRGVVARAGTFKGLRSMVHAPTAALQPTELTFDSHLRPLGG